MKKCENEKLQERRNKAYEVPQTPRRWTSRNAVLRRMRELEREKHHRRIKHFLMSRQ